MRVALITNLVHLHFAAVLTIAAFASASCAPKFGDKNGASGTSNTDTHPGEPNLPCIVDDIEYDGKATYYAADGSGACSFPVSPSDMRVVALSREDYADAQACGTCIEVDGPDGSVTVRVVDRCSGCDAGHIDLSAQAFAQIAQPDQGRVPVAWRFVACPSDGTLRYHFKEGSNQWWTAVQIRDHRYPIAKVEIKAENTNFITAKRSSYNYFIVEAGMGPGPYDFRVIDTLGHVLEDQDIEFSPDTLADGHGQFPVCDEEG